MTGKIIAKELKPDLMLYDAEQDEVHILNPTAQLIYKLSREGKDLPEIEQAIRKSFHLEKNQYIHEDIQKCIEELRNKNLI